MIQWKNMWMERDNVTPCWVRITTAIGIVSYMIYSAIQVYHSKVFDYVSFASGFTMILVGGAGGTRLKLDTEASADTTSNDTSTTTS